MSATVTELEAPALVIGGVTPFTATDFPGRLAAVAFVQGCPWRCRYCHNPHLQPRCAGNPVSWQDFAAFLRRRVGLIDAVVFSGGEPTIDPALPQAMVEVRRLGFAVGLHTACIYPRRLATVLPLVDWVGFDVKAPFDRYQAITGRPGSGERVRDAIRMIVDSGVEHECRTTIHPGLHRPDEIEALAAGLARMGVRRYALQCVRTQGVADGTLVPTPADYPDPSLLTRLRPLFEQVIVRREDA